MEIYTIANAAGKTARIKAHCHKQHIWNESIIAVSPRVLARVVKELGEAEYYRPIGCCGQASRVFLQPATRL